MIETVDGFKEREKEMGKNRETLKEEKYTQKKLIEEWDKLKDEQKYLEKRLMDAKNYLAKLDNQITQTKLKKARYLAKKLEVSRKRLMTVDPGGEDALEQFEELSREQEVSIKLIDDLFK